MSIREIFSDNANYPSVTYDQWDAMMNMNMPNADITGNSINVSGVDTEVSAGDCDALNLNLYNGNGDPLHFYPPPTASQNGNTFAYKATINGNGYSPTWTRIGTGNNDLMSAVAAKLASGVHTYTIAIDGSGNVSLTQVS